MNTSNHSVTIRQCTVEDAEMLAALARRTFYHTFTGTCSEEDMRAFLEEFYNVRRMRMELEDSEPPSYFAMVNGVPAGYISFAQRKLAFPGKEEPKAIELIRLYVDKRYHGQGVAQALMALYLDTAASLKCDYLWLGVWEHNYRAQRFYSKYGFEFTGHTHPFPIGLTPQTDEWWAREL